MTIRFIAYSIWVTSKFICHLKDHHYEMPYKDVYAGSLIILFNFPYIYAMDVIVHASNFMYIHSIYTLFILEVNTPYMLECK